MTNRLRKQNTEGHTNDTDETDDILATGSPSYSTGQQLTVPFADEDGPPSYEEAAAPGPQPQNPTPPAAPNQPRQPSSIASDGYKPPDPMIQIPSPSHPSCAPPPTADTLYIGCGGPPPVPGTMHPAVKKHLESAPGFCFSTRGGCFWSDMGGCFWSSNQGCFCSDHAGFCFSDHGGCFCSDYGGCFCSRRPNPRLDLDEDTSTREGQHRYQ
ncbi:hypothetical protein B0H66DRAFT_592182 [Apodospora peruviana]|uniref:Uncharacterized protein n=1 Tax=Apodospora peruviana TaxID=516989 RepID=A0AAE0HZP0_9PEZI|nr:hypothetical protein B0H66DRAFT_592182 [Apodospora peruviana]